MMLVAAGLSAQVPDSGRAGIRRPPGDTVSLVRPDTVRASAPAPPISPGRAFLQSFLVPGLGQRTLGRSGAEAFFVAVEFGTLLKVVDSRLSLNYARRFGRTTLIGYRLPDRAGQPLAPVYTRGPLAGVVRSRRQQFEDWMALLVFNHLLAGADAFVAAHLWDVPAQVSIQALPDGRPALGVRVAW